MMRITALRPLVRGLHTSRTACNAASTSTSNAEPITTGSADASKAADAVQVTESGRRDIESARSDQSAKKSFSKQRSSKAPAPEISLDILTEDISMLLPEGTATPAPSSSPRRSRSTPHSNGQRAQGGPSGERSSRTRDRSDRPAQGDRGRERDQQSQQYQGQRRPRAGGVQRAAARSSPRAASGASSSFGDLETQDNRPRGKQAVEPIEFDTSFKALFGRSNLVGAASASASRVSKKDQSAETSDWAVQRGMKADQARREEILRAAGAYLSETPTSAFPSTLPAKTPAPQRARTIAQWTMAMNPSIDIAAQRQASKVFDAFLK